MAIVMQVRLTIGPAARGLAKLGIHSNSPDAKDNCTSPREGILDAVRNQGEERRQNR
ncbi:hypothetical protein [Bradyrhizobium sp. CCBAU 51753]|uniref:hypothetical protein n=1 Tax=Bradyrhizobium sp. CCBAU 51753 TaxID=1325100 RepID=UPI00188D94D5|nr:hypothetical protein [Bradyrhizobium sp. CCBAU 51753]